MRAVTAGCVNPSATVTTGSFLPGTTNGAIATRIGKLPSGIAPTIALSSGDTATAALALADLGTAGVSYPLRVRTVTSGRLTTRTFKSCSEPGFCPPGCS